MDEMPVEDIHISKRCPECKRGVLVQYDFVFATLTKCSEESCTFEIKRRKK